MKVQNAFIKREDFKTSPVLLFIAIYIFAILLVITKDPANALSFIGTSGGMLFLGWLAIEITKKNPPTGYQDRKPGLGASIRSSHRSAMGIRPVPAKDKFWR